MSTSDLPHNVLHFASYLAGYVRKNGWSPKYAFPAVWPNRPC